MAIDPQNPVVALCVAGMTCGGGAAEALRLFEEAWNARRDDYDAAIAAHYLARQQPTPALTLEWDARAVAHGESIGDDRSAELLPSLYLNLADSLFAVGQVEEARLSAERAAANLPRLQADGYRAFVANGIARLQAKLSGIDAAATASG